MVFRFKQSFHKFNFGLAEFVLGQIQCYAGHAHNAQKSTDVIQMDLSILRAHPNIICTRVSKIMNRSQHRSNSADKCCSSVLETEWHPKPFVETVVGYECSQPAVCFRQQDLPVTRTCIECTDKLFFADAAQRPPGWLAV